MENSKFKRINMGFNFKLAEEIISCFNQEDISHSLDALGCIDVIDAEGIIKDMFEIGKKNILNPQKYTLLHCFCEQYLYHYLMNERCFLLDEICDDLDKEEIIPFIGNIEKILKEYDKTIAPYAEEILNFDKKYIESDGELHKEYKNLVATIFDNILENFDFIEADIVEATFYILYNNKEFLFKFNQYLSRFTTKDFLPACFFNRHNHIKRVSYYPKWLTRAVFYRDRGRCQSCGKDLSGYLSRLDERELHYDHIVPLKQGGTNDATNFQILCNDCNLSKNGELATPIYFYEMHW